MSKKSPPAIAPQLAHLEHVPFSTLTPFQNDLKLLTRREYQKLKRSLMEYGIIVPFYVWIDDGGVCWINDGHQRHRVFTGEGWDRLDVPIIRIAASTLVEAKKRLLVVSSQYGKITQEGWDTFTVDMPQDWLMETVHFDALPFVFGDWSNAPESFDAAMGNLPTEDRAPFQQMTFTLHDLQVEQVKAAVGIAKGMGAFDSENENSNGNALARICEIFITDYGQS